MTTHPPTRTRTVRRLVTWAAGLSLLMMTVTAAIAAKWDVIRPDKGGRRTVIVVKSKEWAYWRLKPGQRMTFELQPGEYRVITRADLNKTKDKEVPYTFRLGIDNPEGRLYSRATKRDKQTHLRGKEQSRIGNSRIVYFSSENGNQRLTISLDKNAAYTVYFRVQIEAKAYRSGTEYVAVTPSSYRDAISVETHENINTYYAVDHEQRLAVEVNGPTTIKVLTRLVLDESMRGEIKFPLAVYEDGALKNTYSLTTSASQVSRVLDRSDVLPSRGEAFFIEAPRGRHTYQFVPPERQFDIMLRFFLPQDDLTNEPDEE